MKVKYIVVSALLLAATYGGYLLYNQITLLQKTCVKMVNHRLTGLLSKNAQLSITLRITNKSDIDLLATGEVFDIYINNNFIAKLNQSDRHVLVRNASTDITLTANFDPSNLVKQGFAAIAQDFNRVRIQIKGKLNIKTSIISVNNLSVNTSMTLAEILAPSNQQSTC